MADKTKTGSDSQLHLFAIHFTGYIELSIMYTRMEEIIVCYIKQYVYFTKYEKIFSV